MLIENRLHECIILKLYNFLLTIAFDNQRWSVDKVGPFMQRFFLVQLFQQRNDHGIPKIVAKIESEEPTLRLAVLIDADNGQSAVIEGLLAEIARFGEATVKRIYGDITAPTSASWKKVLQRYAIKAGSAICLHDWKERHRQYDDY